MNLIERRSNRLNFSETAFEFGVDVLAVDDGPDYDLFCFDLVGDPVISRADTPKSGELSAEGLSELVGPVA